MNIALISPNKNAYSETFIQQHRANLDGTIIFYFNGGLPKENDIEGKLLKRFQSLIYKFIKKLKFTNLSINELALLKSFKKQKIQVVVAEYGTTAVSVLRVCEYLKLPLIPIFHGFDASITSILENNIEAYKNLFQYSHRIIAVSTKIAETLINLGCDPKKMVVTPCAPDDCFFEITPNFKTPLFIGVGRFVDKKAPYYTIFAFLGVLQKFPDAKLVIAGEGPLLNACKNVVKYLNILDNVEFPGVITQEKLIEYFKEALAFVQHSIVADDGDSEGTPVAILEASAAGLPVIATKHAGIQDVIIDTKTGFLVYEHDVDCMAEKMLLLLNDFSLAQSMGNEGRAFVKKQFSKDKHIGVLNNVITNAVKAKNRSGSNSE
ncbi:MAG TPA: glycosyltransferase [Lutibacter sp.]